MPFQFEDFLLDIERGELQRGGEPVHLQPKHFELLVYLIQNRDRVVSKRQIFDAVWPNVAVSEAAMSSAIRDLRVALGDSGPEKWAVRTLPRRGFRFIAAVREVSDAQTPRAASGLQLYGRGAAVDLLRAAHARAAAGDAQLVLLDGAPGIGKTACAAVATAEFADSGSAVHHAWCRRGPGAPLYWPWIQWLRSVQRGLTRGESTLESEVDECLGPLWAAGASSLGGEESATGPEGTVDYRLFDAVSARIEAVAEEAPQVLVLEDLDAALEPSLELLEFVLRQLARARVLVIATVRGHVLGDGSALRTRLDEWTRHVQCTRAPLGPLEASEVRRWVEDAVSAAKGVDAARIAELCGGNPLWIEHWLEAACSRALAPTEVPHEVSDLALARLSGLDARAQEVLRVAACSGDFESGVLARMAGCTEVEAEASLRAAQARYVLETPSSVGADFAFSSPLYPEILRAEVSEVERRRLASSYDAVPQDSPAAAPAREAPSM